MVILSHQGNGVTTVKTTLCKACSSNFQLTEQFIKVSDPDEAQDLTQFRQHEATATSELKNTLLLEATRLDAQASLSQPTSRSSVKAHTHDFSMLSQTCSMMTDDTDSYSLPIDSDGNFKDNAVLRQEELQIQAQEYVT
eukprot:jgi/Psemu1/61206/gm1.61206_g